MPIDLNAQRALVFRITHKSNLPWIMGNGLRSANSAIRDGNFIQIGNPDLIERRRGRLMPPPLGGQLSDYVPFYFTPFSPMMFNIKTGWNGLRQRRNDEIVILVSSVHRWAALDLPFVFSDRHAYLMAARFSSDAADLDRIPWDLLRERDFKRDPEDPGKIERYEAEALVKDHVPVGALLGVACFNQVVAAEIGAIVNAAAAELRVLVRPGWYF